MSDIESTVTIEDQEYQQICGYRISGLFISWPCVKEPGHEGEHAFAGFYAQYYMDPETEVIYMREGRS